MRKTMTSKFCSVCVGLQGNGEVNYHELKVWLACDNREKRETSASGLCGSVNVHQSRGHINKINNTNIHSFHCILRFVNMCRIDVNDVYM